MKFSTNSTEVFNVQLFIEPIAGVGLCVPLYLVLTVQHLTQNVNNSYNIIIYYYILL